MSSELKVNKIWPRSLLTSYIEMNDGEVVIFPMVSVDSIVSTTGSVVNIEGWDASTYVLITGDQTIAGVKTFTSIPVLPATNPTTDNQATRKAYVDGLISTLNSSMAAMIIIPVGGCLPYAGSTAPTGFLLCNGASLPRTTYANLFAVIGTSYGSLSADTFNVPNIQGRMVVGKSTDAEFITLGQTGGAKTHTLTIAEMPSHSHSVWYLELPAGHGSDGDYGFQFNTGSSTNTGTTGSGGSHNNLQPYITLNYIIKY